MSHHKLNIKGSVLITDTFTKDLGHSISKAEWTEGGVLVLFDADPGYDKRMHRQNVVLLDNMGEVIWTVADSDTPGEFRPYTGFRFEPEGLRLYTSFGADFRLDLKTGNVKYFDSSK